ncbi:MAG: hypothetical protein GYB64_20445, partial [Chloroflexi bacterium]|nr:hypothetical protein [Chloroflexota bacterium]
LQTHQAKPYFFHRETPLLAGLVERGLATTDEIHTQQPDYRAWYITPLGQDVYANHRALRFPPGGAAFALNADEEPVAGTVVGYIRFPARLMPFARFTSGSQTWKVSALRLRSEGE